MRPAGGFIGSYGVLTLNHATLTDINVDDIYNADRQFNQKYIPPRELQAITTDWGARDANWFFDFPTSARKVMAFLEQTDLYQHTDIEFAGAIAINTNVLGSILNIIGPIDVPSYGHVLTSENFLSTLQHEVEAGRDKQPGQNPKRILSVLAPLLLEKLSVLTDEQKFQRILEGKTVPQLEGMLRSRSEQALEFITVLHELKSQDST